MNCHEQTRIRYIQQNVQILKDTDSLYVYLLHEFPKHVNNRKKARENENMRNMLKKIQVEVRKNLQPYLRWKTQPIY